MGAKPVSLRIKSASVNGVLEKVVGKIKICPVSRRGNLGGLRGSEIENVGNLPNGWTD